MKWINRTTKIFCGLSACLCLSACQTALSATLSAADLTPTISAIEQALAAQPSALPPLRLSLTPTRTMLLSATATKPALTQTPEICADPLHGRVDRYEVVFSPVTQPAVFRVYLPPCFTRDGPVRYPVLYILHGQSYKDDQWDRMGIDETADKLISAGTLPPFLIVMPLERNTLAELTDTTFGADLINQLVPWIDTAFPTCAERTCRAIGGLSRGGAWALRLGFQNPALFGAIGLHSTPPFISDPNQFPDWLKKTPPDQVPDVYIDIGRLDPYRAPAAQFERILFKYRVPHVWYLYNGTHNEDYWVSHMADYLKWYGSHWQSDR